MTQAKRLTCRKLCGHEKCGYMERQSVGDDPGKALDLQEIVWGW